MKNLNRTRRTLSRVFAVLVLTSLAACGGSKDAPKAQSQSAAKTSAAMVVSAPSASIQSLTKVSETRVGRSDYDYVYRVTLQNGPVAQGAWSATLTSAGAGVTIIDNSVNFGPVAANGTVTSTDTITLRQDRTVPFNPAALVWNLVPETATQALARLETTGIIPVLDRTTSLGGPDANGNGIRDDIDLYIAKLNLTLPLRQAAEQLAKGYQAAVTLNSADPAVTGPVDTQIRDAVSCAWHRFPKVSAPGTVTAHQIVANLEKLTANTEARTLSYLKYNGSLNGTVTSLPQGDGCAN